MKLSKRVATPKEQLLQKACGKLASSSGADIELQKSQSKFLNKFPGQPYLGYFTYQLTKHQFFQIYYIIITIIIIVILLLLSSTSLLSLFLLKSWSVVGLQDFINITIIIIVSAKILERCGVVGLQVSLACLQTQS